MAAIPAENRPISTLDPYTDLALLNPWPLYRELREMGPVVWLEKYGMFALTRYDVVVKALRDWDAFPYTRLEEIHTDVKRLADATRPPVVTRQNGRHNGKHSIDQPRKAKS